MGSHLLGDERTALRALCRVGAVCVAPTLSAAPALSLCSAWVSFLALSQVERSQHLWFHKGEKSPLGRNSDLPNSSEKPRGECQGNISIKLDIPG